MLQDTIKKIENIIEHSKKLSPERRAELEALVKELKSELTELEKTEKDQANSIAGFTKLAAHESLREKSDEELLHISAQGLKASIREFEITHPNLTRLIQQISIAFGV